MAELQQARLDLQFFRQPLQFGPTVVVPRVQEECIQQNTHVHFPFVENLWIDYSWTAEIHKLLGYNATNIFTLIQNFTHSYNGIVVFFRRPYSLLFSFHKKVKNIRLSSRELGMQKSITDFFWLIYYNGRVISYGNARDIHTNF